MLQDELYRIKQAIEHEMEGYNYYMAQSNKWNSQGVEEIFKYLAEEELMHAKWLEKLLDVRENGLSPKMLDFIDSIGAPKLFNWEKVKNFEFESMKEVLLHAMETEYASYEFYKNAKKTTTSLEAVDLYNKLSEWELSHYQLFKSKLEEISD